MKNEIKFITELLSKTDNLDESSNGNFEVEFEEIKTEISKIDLIKLSEKEFKLMSSVNSNTTQNYISQIIKLKNNSTIEFNKFILTTYLKSIE